MHTLILLCALLQPSPADSFEDEMPPPEAEKNQHDPDEGLFVRNAPRHYEISDFYFYDEKSVAQGLSLSQKIAINFLPQWWDEESANLYIARLQEKLGPVLAIERASIESRSYTIITLDTSHFTDYNQHMVNLINSLLAYEMELLGHRTVEILPVVIADGRECITSDQIEIETPPSISKEQLLLRLHSKTHPLGDFSAYNLKEIQGAPHHFQLTVRKLVWPTNILTLANLIREQPWVKNAHPVFLPIGLPITFAFTLNPAQSPTLGEQRTIKLTVTLYDTSYDFDETLVPRFGEGNFSPVPHVEPCFLETHDPVVVKREENGHRIIDVSWTFYLYKPGVYKFSPVPIFFSYLDGEERVVQNTTVNPGTLLVGNITRHNEDIQPLVTASFRGPDRILDDAPLPKKTTVSSLLYNYGTSLGVLLIIFGLVVIGFVSVPFVSHYRAIVRARNNEFTKKFDAHQKLTEMAHRLKGNACSYEEAEHALRSCMEICLGIPFNTDLENLNVVSSWSYNDVLAEALTELTQRHNPRYISDEETKSRLVNNLILIAHRAFRVTRRT